MRHNSNKSKESSNIATVQTINDHSLSAIKKVPIHLNRQDSFKLNNSNNDQQWQTVSSNKGQRKGPTYRRDITDEIHVIQKNTKASSTSSGKYFYLYIQIICSLL